MSDVMPEFITVRKGRIGLKTEVAEQQDATHVAVAKLNRAVIESQVAQDRFKEATALLERQQNELAACHAEIQRLRRLKDHLREDKQYLRDQLYANPAPQSPPRGTGRAGKGAESAPPTGPALQPPPRPHFRKVYQGSKSRWYRIHTEILAADPDHVDDAWIEGNRRAATLRGDLREMRVNGLWRWVAQIWVPQEFSEVPRGPANLAGLQSPGPVQPGSIPARTPQVAQSHVGKHIGVASGPQRG